MEWVAFLVVAGGTLAAAVGLVVRPNPLHAALLLVANLFGVAVLYLLQAAEFLALVQVIVYAGAIMVLFVFAIMLLIPGRAEAAADPLAGWRRLALPVAAVLGLVVLAVVTRGGRDAGGRPAGAEGTAAELGRRLFTDYLVPFEVTSVLLLAALVGALALAKRREA